jgi:hypothetical protein
MATSAKQITIRELGGEIWAEIAQLQNDPDGSLIGKTDFRAAQELSDLVMGVLARYEGSVIVNHRDLPVKPLKHKF